MKRWAIVLGLLTSIALLPTWPVSGLAAGLSLAGCRELFAAGGCPRCWWADMRSLPRWVSAWLERLANREGRRVPDLAMLRMVQPQVLPAAPGVIARSRCSSRSAWILCWWRERRSRRRYGSAACSLRPCTLRPMPLTG